jgi:hypothetical protein
MYIQKKHISRRTVLRGAGYAMSLPFLDAMVPAATALAQTAAAPRPRMGFFYLPHGAIMEKWTPATTGTEFELPYILEPFTPYKEHMTIVSGLDNPAANGVVHAVTPGTWLSCVAPRRSHAPLGGVTVDQIAAQHIGQSNPLPSLECAVEESGGSNACDGTYGCSFGNTISLRTPTTPLPMEYDPRKIFERLFGRGATVEERAEISKDFTSILDMVSEEAKSLDRNLAAEDRVILTNYLESVREIERRVQNLETSGVDPELLPSLPTGVPNFDERLRLVFDMIAVAYQTDVTRVIAFMMAAEVSNSPYPQIGIPDAFHPLSHHNNIPASMERLSHIQRYHSDVFATFLAKMAEMPDGENTVLENSVFLYGGNMSNSNAHDHFPLPITVFGKGAGAIRGGQHLKYPDRTPLANLHVSLMRSVGIEIDEFGDSTGDLSEVLA